MEISQSSLAWLYLCAMLLGCALGAVYDLLRITRVFLGVRYTHRGAERLSKRKLPFLKECRRKKENPALGVVIFLEDFLFCVFCGIAMILLFYVCNNGKIRYSVFPVAVAGFLCYRGTLGRLVMLFSEVIAFALKTTVRYVFFFLSFPFRLIGRTLKKEFCKTLFRVRAAQTVKKRRRYTEKERARSALNACGLLSEEMAQARRIKRGKKIAKKQKAVQPDAVDPHFACYTDRGFDRRVRK